MIESGVHRFERLGGFHAGRDDQLGGHLGMEATEAVVGSMVEGDTVEVVTLPAITTHGIEALRGLDHCFQQQSVNGRIHHQF